ncbi:hypothetical protein AB0M11_32385 [Streptomyces sp. NPDC051987]|uniref:hypothetical protein n=1 Tax=Streptomyces sp. NPDC051987 TaxID=3155808 RepID=UPI0034195BFB
MRHLPADQQYRIMQLIWGREKAEPQAAVGADDYVRRVLESGELSGDLRRPNENAPRDPTYVRIYRTARPLPAVAYVMPGPGTVEIRLDHEDAGDLRGEKCVRLLDVKHDNKVAVTVSGTASVLIAVELTARAVRKLNG